MKNPEEERPGFVVTPTFRQRARSWSETGQRWLAEGRSKARSWPFTAPVARMLGATVVVAALAFVMSGGVLFRLITVCWLAFMALQALQIIQKVRVSDEGGHVEYTQEHGDAASDFTVDSGILERDEVVAYDERPH